MRILASVLPGTGHLRPLLPTLHALRQAGHAVVLASAEPLRSEVEAAGLDFAAVGPAWHESDAEAILPGFRRAGPARQLQMFAELATATLPDLLTLSDRAQPSLTLRDPYEFAMWLAAERRGLPMIVHGVGSVPPTPFVAALASEELNGVRAAAGLSEDRDLKSLSGRGIVTMVPPSLRVLPMPPPDAPQRLVRMPSPGPPRLPFLRTRPGQPLVYVTLGPVFNTAVDLLSTLVSGVAALDVEVVVTTGQTIDPQALGRQPSHVHAFRFVSQEDLLGAVAAVVCHGGFGTVYGALSLGVPLVVAPLAADQPAWAMGSVTAGAAVSLAPARPPEEILSYVTDPAAVTAAKVAEATGRVLHDPGYREAAQRVATEIAALPLPTSIVPWLESVARDR